MSTDQQTTTDKNRLRPEDPVQSRETTGQVDLLPDAAATLQQVEKLLSEIRAALDAGARDGIHRQYSIGRAAGSILQVVVTGLVILALLDWLLQAPAEPLLIKLAFAAVLQLAALTAFVLSRGGS